MALISCQKLQIGYDKTIVSALDFSVLQDDYLCIVGENGVGKSTLIKTLLRLIKPLGGKIQLGDGLISNEIGYLPQQFDGKKNFPAKVGEIVLSGCLNRCGLRPFFTRTEKQLAKTCLEKTGIQQLSNQRFGDLSGGQQRRVLLARALCATRRLLLLDEPVAGLDPLATKEMYELLNKLNHDDGIAVVMVSHDIFSSVNRAKHVIHLGEKPKFYGETRDYINTPIYRAFIAKEKDF